MPLDRILRSLVTRLDRLLRQWRGIFVFSDAPDCLFRLRIAQAGRTMLLPDGEIPAGAMVLELHLWNEHVPSIPAAGPDLAWAIRNHRNLVRSCRSIARYIDGDPRLANTQALGGTTVLAHRGDGPGGSNLLERLGFTLFPYHPPLGRFGEFWENAYAWALMWVYNAASLRQRRFLQLQRTEFWMSASRFRRLYGGD